MQSLTLHGIVYFIYTICAMFMKCDVARTLFVLRTCMRMCSLCPCVCLFVCTHRSPEKDALVRLRER